MTLFYNVSQLVSRPQVTLKTLIFTFLWSAVLVFQFIY